MKKWYKNLKLMVGAATMLGVMAAAPVVHGGILWTGIDPEVHVNGERFNVYIEWPENKTCFIDGMIDVDFWYPKGATATLVSESFSTFPCPTGGLVHALTKTNLKDGNGSDPNQNGILVSAKVNTSVQMPVNVKVYRNGELVQTCSGESDTFVFCEPLKIR